MRRAECDAEFRREMLKTGVELLLTGDREDAESGREKLRTYVNATIGSEQLASQLGKSPKSLMRMLSAIRCLAGADALGIVGRQFPMRRTARLALPTGEKRRSKSAAAPAGPLTGRS